MAETLWSKQARGSFLALRKSPDRAELYERVRQRLLILREAPGDGRVRSRRMRIKGGGVWSDPSVALPGAQGAERAMTNTVTKKGRQPMHEVRVYQNRHEGTLWWGEDDRGFTGGADTLDELLAYVQEWAEAEGTLDVLAVRLVTTAAPPPPVMLSQPPGSSTLGVPAVRVEFSLAPA